jgi:hypothetical protein
MNTPGSENSAGSSMPIEVLPREVLRYRPHSRACCQGQAVAHAQAGRLQLVGHRLRTLGGVAGQRDHLDAALLELGLQAAELEQVLQADRAVQAAVEDHQREVRRASAARSKSPWSSVGTCSAGTGWRASSIGALRRR